MTAIQYQPPDSWIHYRPGAIAAYHTQAKAAVLALTMMPFQRSWADDIQEIQLKREVAGTSRIEGADFTDDEFEKAVQETPEDLLTRSQRQAAACIATYRWIGKLPDERPIDQSLILEIHRRIVTGADDDHSPPGVLRGEGINVTFGSPKHRGVEGGTECEQKFNDLCNALNDDFLSHDPLIQALALHYHLAAMHPFEDGNGRMARAVEALLLQRSGLRAALFIAMSNYYYEEKPNYLKALAKVRFENNDITEFLIFGLKGIEQQCRRLSDVIRTNLIKVLFRDVMYDLFGRLRTERKRIIGKRQISILNILLADESLLSDLTARTKANYASLKTAQTTFMRDLNYLIGLGAVEFEELGNYEYRLFINLEWPTEITETEFFERIQQMPRAKTVITRLG